MYIELYDRKHCFPFLRHRFSIFQSKSEPSRFFVMLSPSICTGKWLEVLIECTSIMTVTELRSCLTVLATHHHHYHDNQRFLSEIFYKCMKYNVWQLNFRKLHSNRDLTYFSTRVVTAGISFSITVSTIRVGMRWGWGK